MFELPCLIAVATTGGRRLASVYGVTFRNAGGEIPLLFTDVTAIDLIEKTATDVFFHCPLYDRGCSVLPVFSVQKKCLLWVKSPQWLMLPMQRCCD